MPRAPVAQPTNARQHLRLATKCATISRGNVQEVALTRPDGDGVLIYLGFEHNLVALHDANGARLGRDLFFLEKIGRLFENLLRIIGLRAAASQRGTAVVRVAGFVFVSNAESDQPSCWRKAALARPPAS
jgi:transposase